MKNKFLSPSTLTSMSFEGSKNKTPQGVTLHEVNKNYGKIDVLKNISLDIKPGEFMILLGPSGSGKSTLLRIIAGLEKADSGKVEIGGKPVDSLIGSKRDIAMVFQNYALYPNKTVFENMAFSLQMSGMKRKDYTGIVQKTASALQIEQYLNRKPAALSGGQRQRVAIGRALVRNPSIFLFDEPLSNLDVSLRQEMRLELIRLHRELSSTMIYVTHDQTEAMTMGDRIAVFNEGKIDQVADPLTIYRAPATKFVASALGSPSINVFDGNISALDEKIVLSIDGCRDLTLRCKKSLIPENSTSFGVRPEGWILSENIGWEVKVDIVENLGDSVIVHVRVSSHLPRISIRLDENYSLEIFPESTLYISPKEGALHCFSNDGICSAII